MANLVPPFVIVLTESTTYTVVTGGGVFVYDKKTGKLIKIVWEMGGIVIPHPKAIKAIEAGISFLENTEGLTGVETLRLQTVQFLGSVVDELATDVAAKVASSGKKP